MDVKVLMAQLEAKHPGESEYLQAVQEVLESIEEDLDRGCNAGLRRIHHLDLRRGTFLC